MGPSVTLKVLGRENISLREDVLHFNVIELSVTILLIFGIISPLLNTCLGKIIIYYSDIGNELLANNYILFNPIF
jgi:hypothetical protein